MHRGAAQNTANRDQISFYLSGPGNDDDGEYDFGDWTDKVFGGAFGVGATSLRDDALNALEMVWRPGDRISVVGFSRGAAVARMFCAALDSVGIHGQRVYVDFLGCFDTVGAFLPFGRAQQETLFHNLTVSPIVRSAYHAVALDEDRRSFEPNLMNADPHRVTESWFPGIHTDVGGGNADSGLGDGALQWMVGQASLGGFHYTIPDMHPNHNGPIIPAGGIYRREPRRVGIKVDGEFSEKTPLLDGSVVDRHNDDPSYRPELFPIRKV